MLCDTLSVKELVEELKNVQESYLKLCHYDSNENSGSKKCFKSNQQLNKNSLSLRGVTVFLFDNQSG